MLKQVCPKLPMRNKQATMHCYRDTLSFEISADYEEYLIIEKDDIEIHFFLHRTLNPLENDGQVYIRTSDIDVFYQSLLNRGVAIHPNGALATKPWGQKEFSLLDPDHNLLTFGEEV